MGTRESDLQALLDLKSKINERGNLQEQKDKYIDKIEKINKEIQNPTVSSIASEDNYEKKYWEKDTIIENRKQTARKICIGITCLVEMIVLALLIVQFADRGIVEYEDFTFSLILFVIGILMVIIGIAVLRNTKGGGGGIGLILGVIFIGNFFKMIGGWIWIYFGIIVAVPIVVLLIYLLIKFIINIKADKEFENILSNAKEQDTTNKIENAKRKKQASDEMHYIYSSEIEEYSKYIDDINNKINALDKSIKAFGLSENDLNDIDYIIGRIQSRRASSLEMALQQLDATREEKEKIRIAKITREFDEKTRMRQEAERVRNDLDNFLKQREYENEVIRQQKRQADELERIRKAAEKINS